MAAEEPVTAPDQHKPSNPRLARLLGVLIIVGLLSMLFGNHEGRVEDLWLIGIAALIAAMLVGDWLMRKNGLRS